MLVGEFWAIFWLKEHNELWIILFWIRSLLLVKYLCCLSFFFKPSNFGKSSLTHVFAAFSKTLNFWSIFLSGEWAKRRQIQNKKRSKILEVILLLLGYVMNYEYELIKCVNWSDDLIHHRTLVSWRFRIWRLNSNTLTYPSCLLFKGCKKRFLSDFRAFEFLCCTFFCFCDEFVKHLRGTECLQKLHNLKNAKKKSVTIKKRKHFVILTWKSNVLCKTVPEEGFEVAFEWIIFYWKSFFVCSDWFLKIACKCQRSREKIDDIHW